MNILDKVRIIIPVLIFIISQTISAQKLPSAITLESMLLANKYFMEKWPDPGKAIVTDRERPSNIWTRGVYYEGLMTLYKINPNPAFLKYATECH